MSDRNRVSRRGALKTGAMAGVAVLSGCGGEETTLSPSTVFRHGVAAGLPTADSLSLWTRVDDMEGEIPVRVLVSPDIEFRQDVVQAEGTARVESDYVVRIDVSGLQSSTDYYYRFELVGMEIERSRRGRARTLARRDESPEGVRIATACCASYAHGYFHAYRRIAEEPLDAVVHLGDYIYEYGNGEYGELRTYDPPHELRTLADYRRRYAYYRLDPDLQFLHSCHAMMFTWDDHEIVNNANPEWSQFHDAATDGDYLVRVDAATRAHDEWTPGARPLWQLHAFGDLVDLFVLETRIYGRDEAAGTMLGAEQRDWLLSGLRASTAKWKIIMGSVQFAPHPEFWNFDAWDAFPEERTMILEALRDANITNVLFVCGDGHKSFVDQLLLDDTPIAAEVMTPAISSPNQFGAQARAFESDIYARNPATRFVDSEQRGYVLLDIRRETLVIEHRFVESVEMPQGGGQRVAKRFELRDGDPLLRELM